MKFRNARHLFQYDYMNYLREINVSPFDPNKSVLSFSDIDRMHTDDMWRWFIGNAQKDDFNLIISKKIDKDLLELIC